MDITKNHIYIHEGHTKLNMIDMINNSNMDIFQPYLHSKEKLLTLLSSYLSNDNNPDIEFYSIKYPFKTKEDFIKYLGENPVKLTCAEKRQINDTAKNIISYCKSGYDLDKTKYNDFNEIYEDCIKIKEHGDIFCVRTAIALFNIALKQQDKPEISVKMNDITHNKIQLKNTFKKNCIPTFKITHGKFVIHFDDNEDTGGDIKDIMPCNMSDPNI